MATLKDCYPLHPTLVERVDRLKSELKKKGIYISFSEGFRSLKRQNELYEQGRTKPGQIVTNARGSSYSSQHQWGIAVDFYLDMDIDGDGDKKDDAFNNVTGLFEKVGKEAMNLGLGWGGNWNSFKDLPHLYLPDWGGTTKKLKEQYGSPEKFMLTWPSGVTTSPADTQVEFVKEIQRAIGAKVDGITGKKTLSKTPTLKYGDRSTVVYLVQERLKKLGFKEVGEVDGIFGEKTEQAVKEYQKSIGFKYPDGIMDSGKKTWKAILGYR